LTNPPGHLWRDKWTALSGPLSVALLERMASVLTRWVGFAAHSTAAKHPSPLSTRVDKVGGVQELGGGGDNYLAEM